MEDFGGFIRGKCMGFSVDIVNLYKNLSENKKEYVLSKQVLRSGTSIGANLFEAQKGISKNDFLAKIYISLKEAAETEYWIELLLKTSYISIEEYNKLNSKCKELVRLLDSITKKMKQ
ncbi:MAG: four helix bundle protein [Bacteroidales bacterium]|nr:four helix bundle protein [Bacteroidales bacterium]MCR5036891.1 four helix bundle protein [Bacteroidales bacterium]